MATRVTARPTTPAVVNTSAMPRPTPVPNQPPMRWTPAPVVMNGMNVNWAMGPIRNAVTGEAACSIEWAKPNTRPSRSGGTTFWKIVCSIASMKGTKNIQMNVPTASSDDRGLDREEDAHRPGDDVVAEEDAQRIRAQPLLRDVEPAQDEAQAQEPPERSPGLDGHQRQAVGVHQGHEHAAQEIVEGGEEDEREEPGHGPHGADRSRDVDPLAFAGSAGASLGPVWTISFSGIGTSASRTIATTVAIAAAHEHEGHAAEGEGDAAGHRRERERDPDRRPEHPVRPVAAVLGHDERDERRDRDVVDRSRHRAGEQDHHEDPEPDAGDRREGAVGRRPGRSRGRPEQGEGRDRRAEQRRASSGDGRRCEPNQNPDTAVSTRKMPPMTEVEMTDRVVRYAQKVRANQTKLFVVRTSKRDAEQPVEGRQARLAPRRRVRRPR